MSNTVEIFRFDSANLPKPFESLEKSNDKFVTYGQDNKYPDFLLSLYEQSPIHSSIVNSKSNYIIGDGLRTVGGSVLDLNVNAADNIIEFVSKLIKDYLIFNYFCVEVVYDRTAKPIEYHFIPAHKIRVNKDKTKFWYFEESLTKKPIIFDRFKPNSKDTTSKIFFFDGYFPSVQNVYPKPEYNGALYAIQTDIDIRKFNLNNVKNHFSPSSIVTFFNGTNISDDVKKEVIKGIKDSYTGAEGKKMIVEFQDAEHGKPAEVKTLSPGDWDKAYTLTAQKSADDIMIGHSVTSPILFGVKTEGQIGGATELEVAFEVFQNTYTRTKRMELEFALNYLFSDSKIIKGKVEFIDKQLFAARLSEELKSKVYTINELRKEAGLPPIANGDRRIDDAVETVVEEKPKEEEDSKKKFSSEIIHLTDADYEKIKDLGADGEEFEFISEGEVIENAEAFAAIELKFNTKETILNYILDNDISGKSLQAISRDLKADLDISVTTTDLKKMLENLADSKLIGVKIEDGKVQITKPSKTEQPGRKIQVMYSYEVREGLGSPIIDTTRPFCRKLVESKRIFTREEIQKMASIFGYDIFKYGGGFYRNPDTGEVTAHCRHQFKARTVVKKTK